MSKWVRRFHPGPDAPARLLCFPHAGGSASTYRPLSTALKGHVEVWAVQYPGRQDRLGEPCAQDLDEIVEATLDTLAPTLADGGPIGLFGHSMGTLLAFEVARRLVKEGTPPAVLFVSAGRGPSLGRPAGIPGLHDAGDEAMLEEVRLLGGTESELLDHPELLDLVLYALRADYAMMGRYEYRPGPVLSCPVIALAGDSDPRVPVESMRAWAEETSGSCDLHVLPGGHFYLEAQLAPVAEHIRAAMRK
ncbi:thioesterase II family protein [Streptomyces sp. NPDC058231]|uniref:thioesterase II family protein n=1 Tax=Streptomyces sp. NPDC058231 TaxID=3346392 RepID=UPI0036EB12B5